MMGDRERRERENEREKEREGGKRERELLQHICEKLDVILARKLKCYAILHESKFKNHTIRYKTI